jgi:3-oxoadipate enol-lactonase
MGPPTAWSTRPRQARIYRGSAQMIDWLGLTPLRYLGELMSYAVSNAGVAALQRSIMRGLRRADPRTVTAAMCGAAESDLPDESQLALHEIPTLILAWKGDATHPVSSAERLAELLGATQLHVAGSFEEMQRWGSLVTRFLAERADE